jgi:hypothetical protein
MLLERGGGVEQPRAGDILMKNRLVTTLALILMLTSAAAQAAPLAAYTGKLRRFSGHGPEQVYGLQIEQDGRDVTGSLPAGVARAIDGVLAGLAVARVVVPQNPHVTMAVAHRAQFELELEFVHATSREQAYLSCFQAWYMGLPEMDADGPNRMVLTGLLSNFDEEARRELTSEYAPLVREYIEQQLGACERKFEGFVVNDDAAVFLHTGLTRWLSGRMHPEYAGFWHLLDGSKPVFEARREQQLVQVDAAQFVAAWLGQIRSHATPEIVFQRLPQVLDLRAGHETRTLLVAQAMRQWATSSVLEHFFRRGTISPSLNAVLSAAESVAEACFVDACFESQEEAFHCRSNDPPRLLKFTLSNNAVGPISFLRAAE